MSSNRRHKQLSVSRDRTSVANPIRGFVRVDSRRLALVLLALLTAVLCVCLSPVFAILPPPDEQLPPAPSAPELVEQSQSLYEAGQFAAAIDLLQQAIQDYRASGNLLQQAVGLSNLSLVYQQLGAWTEATQAIDESLMLVQSVPATRDSQRVLAQALDIQGRLYLAQGQAELALNSWEQATAAYQQAGDAAAAVQSQINQTQALQALGLYRRAIADLTRLNQTLQQQPASLTTAIVCRSLGDALLVTGDVNQAQQAIEQSLAVAAALPETAPVREAIAAATLSLGNLIRAEAAATLNLNNMTASEAIAQLHQPAQIGLSANQIVLQQKKAQIAQTYLQQTDRALSQYQQAAALAPAPSTRLQAQLNQLSLLIATDRLAPASALYPQIQTQLAALPSTHTTIYAQINLAQALMALPDLSAVSIAQLLKAASQSASAIGDLRAESYALGTLAGLYEQRRQNAEAKRLTQQALMLSQAVNAVDISYRWQWQLGRLLKQQADLPGAIAAYSEAVKSLQTLRADLIAVNRDVQFSFRESVEPVYRELVDLLLQPGQPIQTENLQRARAVIEGLQVAELDNFFREACLDTQFQLDRVVDRANLPAAIFYTIVLPDRLEMILKLPQRELLHYTTRIPQIDVERTAEALLTELKKPLPSQQLKRLSAQLYDWLMRPAEPDIAASGVETIVFVLDGTLRSIPTAALYDGQHYLVEKYSTALAPGLQLPDPRPLQQRQFLALVAGLSEARDRFSPLRYVEAEVEQIQADIPSRVLLDQNFTRDNFQQQLNSSAFSIVHIATHGQFSSNAAETFILAWDSPINVNELSDLLQRKDLSSVEPIELLVLSACRTAVGDKRAALGLAGVAVRAGARSTVASLWSVDDESSAALMSEFYQELVNHPISKAEALRRAQQKLLLSDAYSDPRSWAAFVLLGNWL